MSSFRIFDIAGSALAAQSVRLNTVASNLANADAVTGDAKTVYKAHVPVFEATPELGGEETPVSVCRTCCRSRPNPKNVMSPVIRRRMPKALSMRRRSVSSNRWST